MADKIFKNEDGKFKALVEEIKSRYEKGQPVLVGTIAIEKSEEIKALADQKATVIKAEALMQGASLRAKGEQEAALIYAKAYTAEPAFYAFYRSLEAYENGFRHKSDVLVLKPEGQFFNYFHGAQNNSVSKK